MLLACLEDIAQKLSFRLLFLHSWYTYYCSIFTIIKAMALEQVTSSRTGNLYVSCRKDASTLTTLHGIVNCAKNGATRRILSSNRYQRLAAVSPINTFGQIWEFCSQHFRNENLTLEINGGHFGVLHWQQWKPPASTCDKIISAHIYRHTKRIASQQQVNCSQDIVAETCNLPLL